MERKKRSKGRGWESCYVEKNLRDVWCRNESVRTEIYQILQTHTYAAKLVVEINPVNENNLTKCPRSQVILALTVSELEHKCRKDEEIIM